MSYGSCSQRPLTPSLQYPIPIQPLEESLSSTLFNPSPSCQECDHSPGSSCSTCTSLLTTENVYSISRKWDMFLEIREQGTHVGKHIEARVKLPCSDDMFDNKGTLTMLFHRIFDHLQQGVSICTVTTTFYHPTEPGDELVLIAAGNQLPLVSVCAFRGQDLMAMATISFKDGMPDYNIQQTMAQ